MKKILVSLALFIGFVGLAKAGGREGQGWNVTVVTGTATTIFEGKGFLRGIILSSGATTSLGDFIIAYATAPSVANGAGTELIPNHLFNSTAALTGAIVYRTTTTVSGDSNQLTNVWKVGDCEECYVEVGVKGSGGSAPTQGGLHIRKSVQASGQAFNAAVIWSR